MKIVKWFMPLVMGLAFVACQSNDEQQAVEGDEATSEVIPQEKTAKDFLPSKKELNDVSYLVGVNFGSFIKGYNFGDLNMAQVRKGIEDFLKAKQTENPEDFVKQFRVDPNQMDALFNKFLQDRRSYTIYTNKEKEEQFLAKNAKKPGIVVAPSGLQYRIISEGNEVHPTLKDTVYVKYKGSLLDGTVFDQTKEDEDARSFVLNRVVEGWKQGLPLIGEGGEIELYVPYALGYGEYGNRNIEPAATLIFNISLERVGVTVNE